MPIPELLDNVLPEGVHACTLAEIEDRFARYRMRPETTRTSDQRMQLMERLKEFFEAARKSGIVKAVIVDGSFVTAKEVPGDIDLIVVLRDDFDFTQELRPYQSNVIDKAAIKRYYRFDGWSMKENSEPLLEMVKTWSVVPQKYEELTDRTHKGMLRVELC